MSFYEWVKKVSKEAKVKVTDILAMSPSNDPFYCGTPTDIVMAKWVAKIYADMGSPTTLHVRRMHYWVAIRSPPLMPIKKPNGEIYENTDRNWGWLVQACKSARYLGLVPMENFVDRKAEYEQYGYYWDHEDFDEKMKDFSVEGVADTLASDFRIYNPQLSQKYHLEIACEKSTQNDVIVPLCRKYGIDFVYGQGELSLTHAFKMVQRVANIGKPTRVFYISDFDPKGYDMPVSFARKLEWFQRTIKDLPEIKLTWFMLTPKQCKEYNLPRAPIKTGRGGASWLGKKAHFEEVHGVGATELDALESLYPSDPSLEGFNPDINMKKLLEEAISPYFDVEAHNTIIKEDKRIVEAVKEAVLENEEQFREVLKALNVDYDPKSFEIPEANPEVNEEEEEEGWLYNSNRDYANQLRYYKLHKAGIVEENTS